MQKKMLCRLLYFLFDGPF